MSAQRNAFRVRLNGSTLKSYLEQYLSACEYEQKRVNPDGKEEPQRTAYLHLFNAITGELAWVTMMLDSLDLRDTEMVTLDTDFELAILHKVVSRDCWRDYTPRPWLRELPDVPEGPPVERREPPKSKRAR